MRRLHLAGLVLTTLVVAVLLASLVSGIGFGGDGPLLDPRGPERIATAPSEDRLQVEVLNAAGVPGLARAATDMLREHGFDVVFYGNATGGAPDSSVVLARRGDLQAAERVGEAIGIRRARVDPDTTLYLDVTVIIGRDWRQAPEP